MDDPRETIAALIRTSIQLTADDDSTPVTPIVEASGRRALAEQQMLLEPKVIVGPFAAAPAESLDLGLRRRIYRAVLQLHVWTRDTDLPAAATGIKLRHKACEEIRRILRENGRSPGEGLLYARLRAAERDLDELRSRPLVYHTALELELAWSDVAP